MSYDLSDRRHRAVQLFFDEAVTGISTAGAVEYVSAWDDLVVPAASINPTGIAGAMTPITDTTGYLGCLAAADSGTPTCVFHWQLPHTLRLGTDIKPHVHYVQQSGGAVVWQASFKHVPLSGIATAWTTMTSGVDTISAADTAHKGALTSWTLSDATYHFGISDLVLMTLQRRSTDAADTSTADAVVLSGDIHYRRCRLGSLQEAALP